MRRLVAAALMSTVALTGYSEQCSPLLDENHAISYAHWFRDEGFSEQARFFDLNDKDRKSNFKAGPIAQFSLISNHENEHRMTNDYGSSPTPALIGEMMALRAAITVIVEALPRNPALPMRLKTEVEKVRSKLTASNEPMADEVLRDFDKASQGLTKLFERAHEPEPPS